MTRTVSILAATVLAASLVSCSDASGAPQETERRPVPVSVETVTEVTTPITVRRSATIRSRVDVQLVCESAGILVERPLKAGAPVKKGDVIAKLSDAAERAALKAARARLAELIDERSTLDARRQAESAVEQAREMLRRRTVLASDDGIIDRYDAEVGDYLTPGAPVGRLVDPTKLWAVATVLEEEVLLVRAGARISFTVPAVRGESFTGTVVRRGTAALTGSGQFEVEFDVDHDPRVLPGMVATASIPLSGTRPVRALSRDAVFMRHGTPRAFVVVERDGRHYAEERTIVIRAITADPGMVDVLSGIESGTDVVVRGRIGLVSGDPLITRQR